MFLWIILFIIILIIIVYIFLRWNGIQETFQDYDNIKVAIVTLVKKPIQYEMWLKYHFDIVKINYIFIQIEDTPELISTLDKYKSKIDINMINTNHIENQYVTLQKRQHTFITKCIEKCKQMNIHYLLHIDDDELLYVSEKYNHDILNLIKKKDLMNTNHFDFHFKNYEAIYDNNHQKCFDTINFIDCHKNKCRSYANGKSMGKIHKHLYSRGPHYFSGPTLKIDENDACILHFDSCNFEKWKQKFTNLSKITEKEFKKIPFSYYKKSIQKIQECEKRCAIKSKTCQECQFEMKSIWNLYTSNVNKSHIKTISPLSVLIQ
jgi:hypothetical protein